MFGWLKSNVDTHEPRRATGDLDIDEKVQQAMLRQQQNDPSSAERLYLEVLRAKPEHAEANFRLGRLYGQSGRYAEADECLLRALQVDPKRADVHCDLGNIHRLQNRNDEAIRFYEASISCDPDYVAAHVNLATTYRQIGATDMARKSFQRVLELEPGNQSVRYQLGLLLLEREEYHEALGMLRSVAPSRSEHPDFLYHYGVALFRAGELRESVQQFEKMLAKRDVAPGILIKAGEFMLFSKQRSTAENLFSRVLESDPGNIPSIAGLARIRDHDGEYEKAYALLQRLLANARVDDRVMDIYGAVCRSLDRHEEAISRLEKHLQGITQSGNSGRVVHFQLGNLYDDIGEYDKAFEHYRAGNDSTRIKFDRQGYVGLIDRFMNVYRRENLGKLSTSTKLSASPIFVVGMPRSGTSLVTQILASHSAVYNAGESSAIGRLAERSAELAGASEYPEAVTLLQPAQCDMLAEEYLQAMREKGAIAESSATIPVDKMPQNFLHIGFISQLFPGARILHCARNPLDTCLSCYFTHFTGKQYFAYNLDDLAAFNVHYRRLMAHWKATLEVEIMDVVYEDLVNRFDAVTRDMLAFCGLEWEPAVGHFYESDVTMNTASYKQVRQPLYRKSIGRWEHYRQHLGPLVDRLVSS